MFVSYKTSAWIRIGYGFSNSLDTDPDSAKYLDPDSMNPDPKHC